MGNTVQKLNFKGDQYYDEVRKTYKPAVKDLISPLSKTLEMIQYSIIVHNHLFCEVREIQEHVNQKQKPVKVDFNISRFEMLLSLKVILNGVAIESQFISLSKVSGQLLNTSSQLYSHILQAGDKLILEFHYLQAPRHQGALHCLSLPLTPEYPFNAQIKLNCKQTLLFSPSHKLNEKSTELYAVEDYFRGQNLTEFLLVYGVQDTIILHRGMFGTMGYTQEEKYCLYIEDSPKEILLDEIMYLNFPDPKTFEEDTTLDNGSVLSYVSVGAIKCESGITLLNSINRTGIKISVFLDCSQSMEGVRLLNVKQALSIFIKSLPADSFLNICLFGSTHQWLLPQHACLSEQLIMYVNHQLQNIEVMGSTFLYDALKTSSPDELIFIIVDGQVEEDQQIQELKLPLHILGFADVDQIQLQRWARYGGQFKFTSMQNIHASLIDLLQNALIKKDQDITVNSNFVTKKFNNFYCLSSEASNFDIKVNGKYLPIKLESAIRNPYLHIYCYHQQIKDVLLFGETNIQCQPTSFYKFTQLSQTYQLYNPFLCLQVGPVTLIQMNPPHHEGLLDGLIPDPIRDQIARMNFQNRQAQMEQLLGSSFSTANQDNLVQFLQRQQMDGSFLDVVQDIEFQIGSEISIPAKTGKSDQTDQAVPRFVIRQIRLTCIAIAFLKLNYREQRGQWILIFAKAVAFLKAQKVKNWKALVIRAGKELKQTF